MKSSRWFIVSLILILLIGSIGITKMNNRLKGMNQELEQTVKDLDQINQDIERLVTSINKFNILNQRLEKGNEDLLNDLDALSRALDKYNGTDSKK